MVWMIYLLGALFGFIVVYSEPALVVLGKQVENTTSRLIKAKVLMIAMAIAIASALVLSIFRAYSDTHLMFILIPGYILAIILMFFVDEVFSSIGFDSGGIATGPMTSTFIVPFVIGLTIGLDKNVLTTAFGTVSLIALFPIITIEILGLYVKIMSRAKQVKGVSLASIAIDFDFGGLE
jgi:hypothetical protein